MVGKNQVEPATPSILSTSMSRHAPLPHLHFYNSPAVEGEVFVVGDVAELVAEAVGGADGLVDVAVGVAVDPVVDAAGGDVVGGIGGECAVDAAAQELWGDRIEISS